MTHSVIRKHFLCQQSFSKLVNIGILIQRFLFPGIKIYHLSMSEVHHFTHGQLYNIQLQFHETVAFVNAFVQHSHYSSQCYRWDKEVTCRI